ncbi:MAG: hypothetical protein KDK25_05250 [Leptospiraceae bacterium]|nr:hypothetical protein [Leptospiraceae bacterium]
MNLADRIIALQHMFPFSRLRETELSALAEVCIPRQFEPGELVVDSGRTLKRLLILLDGEFLQNQVSLPNRILGIPSLLFDSVESSAIVAGPAGARCLGLEKGHFFRTMYELPEIAQGIVALQAHREVRS